MQLVKNHINILLPLLVISVISRVIPGVKFLYYLTPILLVLFIISGYDQILKNKQLRLLIILLGSFGLWAMLTSLWSDYPLVSLSRSLYFLLVAYGAVFGITLWLNNNTTENILAFLLPANILIVASSLVSLIIGFPENAWTAGNGMGFMGFAIHQNTLGALILFTFPAPFCLLLKKVRNIKTISNKSIAYLLSYILLLASNLLLLILSHSRAVLLSLSVGIFLVFMFYFNIKQRFLFIGGLFIIAILLFTIPSLKSKVENYALKGTSRITANREILWLPSYEAAKIGGLFGIGYGTSTEKIQTQFQQIDEGGRLRREKGNSILAIIEEVGVVGLVLFLLPIIYSLSLLYFQFKANRKSSFNSLIIINLSFIISFLLHSQSEAWWVGTGSFALLIFLMYLSLSPFLSAKLTETM